VFIRLAISNYTDFLGISNAISPRFGVIYENVISPQSPMLEIPPAVKREFLIALERNSVPSTHKPHYLKWLRYYLDYCDQNDLVRCCVDSQSAYVSYLSERGGSLFQQDQAARAISLYFDITRKPDKPGSNPSSETFESAWEDVLERLKRRIETMQYSKKTLRTYSLWLKKFGKHLGYKDPDSVTAKDAAEFFTYLASIEKVASSTQNQAFNALLYVFRHVWKREFEGFDGVIRAKRSKYIPVVLSRREVDLIFDQLKHPFDLLIKLMYGCGLRLFESVNVRINCLNFDDAILTIHDGKGKKDRTVPLPKTLIPELENQVRRVKWLLGQDLESGFNGVFMPNAMTRKFKHAAKELPWQWLFPAPKLTLVPTNGEKRRYHAHESKVGAEIRKAAREASVTKRVTAHTFRHSYASHLLQNHFDIRTIQQLLGHNDVKTTMIYTHTVPIHLQKKPQSPLDF